MRIYTLIYRYKPYCNWVHLFVLDGVSYTHDNLYQLPEELSLCKAKTIEVDGGTGLAFQSHHSPLSNMFYCHIDYDGHHFPALEIAYQYARAKIGGYQRVAEALVDCPCVYRAKSITSDLKDTKECLGCRIKIMTELVRLKFKNNKDCKQWLLRSGTKKLYEATVDKYWATGLVLSKAKDIKDGKFPGQNKLGEILEKVRVEIK